MKVYDILHEGLDNYKRIPVVTVKTRPNIGRNVSKSNSRRDDETRKVHVLGSGVQGSAYGFKSRPNSVVKAARLQGLDDPYLRYVTTVLQHQDNPFFPRIHNAKILEYTASRWDPRIQHADTSEQQKESMRKPQYTLMVNMEKLRPMSGNLKDSASAMLQRLGIDKNDMNPASWGAEKSGPDDYGTDTWDRDLRAMFDDEGMRKELANNTKNPQFKEALNIMEPIWNMHGADMKDDNIMIRLTPHGPQIVLVDPIYPEL